MYSRNRLPRLELEKTEWEKEDEMRQKKREEWQKKEERRKKDQPTLDEELEEYIEKEVVSNEWGNRKTRREK